MEAGASTKFSLVTRDSDEASAFAVRSAPCMSILIATQEQRAVLGIGSDTATWGCVATHAVKISSGETVEIGLVSVPLGKLVIGPEPPDFLGFKFTHSLDPATIAQMFHAGQLVVELGLSDDSDAFTETLRQQAATVGQSGARHSTQVGGERSPRPRLRAVRRQRAIPHTACSS